MRKIKNPYLKLQGYQCFGCDPNNKNGLHLQFFDDGEWVVSHWMPQHHYEGYPNVLHGGIQSTLLDEIGAWTVYVKLGTAAVTSKMNVNFCKPVLLSDGKITLRAKIVEMKRQFCVVKAELFNTLDKVLAEADITYFLFSKEKSINDFGFPENNEDFYEE